MQIVTADTRRSTTTPNATMTTLASPTLGAASVSLWLVEMQQGATGPVHAFDDEVVWSITRGEAELTCEGSSTRLGTGDTAVLPGGVMRRFVAGPEGFSAVVTTSTPGAVVRGDGTPAGTPEWVA
jgi:quercetin dioxygenase-like cupin family protein